MKRIGISSPIGKIVEFFPELVLGVANGWLLLVMFFGAYAATLISFPKEALARLYDRSGESERPPVRRIVVVVVVFVWFVSMGLSPLKRGTLVFGLGMSMYLLGWMGFLASLVTFRNTPVDQPVTGGLYNISRHPQQMAVSVTFLGISIAIGSWTSLIITLLGILGAHGKILAEEEACLKQYGDSYRDYMKRIPRYFLFF